MLLWLGCEQHLSIFGSVVQFDICNQSGSQVAQDIPGYRCWKLLVSLIKDYEEERCIREDNRHRIHVIKYTNNLPHQQLRHGITSPQYIDQVKSESPHRELPPLPRNH